MSRDQKPGRANIVKGPAAPAPPATPATGAAGPPVDGAVVTADAAKSAPARGLLIALFLIASVIAGVAFVAIPELLR